MKDKEFNLNDRKREDTDRYLKAFNKLKGTMPLRQAHIQALRNAGLSGKVLERKLAGDKLK